MEEKKLSKNKTLKPTLFDDQYDLVSCINN